MQHVLYIFKLIAGLIKELKLPVARMTKIEAYLMQLQTQNILSGPIIDLLLCRVID